MYFEKGHLYHIYNQGNNHHRIFFREENYLFFIEKMRVHLLPHCHILAWCLLPNHFHWMVKVNEVEVLPPASSQGLTSSQTLNESIGVMLRSYTRAINKQQSYTGTLFRKATKAQCLDEPAGITPSYYNTRQGTAVHSNHPAKWYPLACFNYIHQNPVKARLVSNAEDWTFSSYRDVVGLLNGTLINRKLVNELELNSNSPDD